MHLLWYSNNIFSIVRRNTLHIARIFSTTSVIPDKVDVTSMTDKDLELYKLYRPERVIPPMRGIDLIKSSRYSKGMAFNLYERQYLGIHGLLPPAFMTEEQQAYRIISKLREQPNDLARYVQLDGLQDRNEKLFYRVVCEHVKELMPIVYTPTVGLACQNFGYIYRHPKGIYVTINDNSISKIHHILSNWPEKDVRAIVVTDGERILGLGDLGTYGMGIPVGKLALYVALGGVQPRWCLPVLLDVGTNKEELLQDPFYIGLRRKRVRGKEYDSFIENFMKACAKRFGQKVLIQFEDFANANAYRLLEKFRDKYCTFNDDIQGTASVVVAGLLSCNKILHKKMSEQTFVFLGAGAAATGIADLCVLQMQHEGLGEIEAHERIYLMNSKGLITRSSPNLKDEHQLYAKDMESIKDLIDVIKKVQPTGIIGVSTVSGSFSEEIIKEMSKINEHPIIFALSNPTNKSECTAEEAFTHTNGKVLFASGSPFPDLRLNGKLYKPGQGNNSYVFPGVALGVILFQVRHIDDELFLIAARQIADMVTAKDIKFGRIYPNLKYIRECSIKIALAIAKHCYANGTAALYPEPEDLEKYIRSQIYSVEYDELIDVTYEWPQEDMKHGFPVPVARRESVEE
ncbi:NAD-dependent malic enzyme, mitochondrial precursor, putative [Brugia malayi]|nr:NAD-dependent malic enzyme, mitochondrial precursor, putative [Brugia malayi]CDP93855.1 Bm6642, isoform c [Brugia malayi]VIO95081.1 NAD-dependent malic enzyme, mitochondrial precursor, putative [Brugia malayi]